MTDMNWHPDSERLQLMAEDRLEGGDRAVLESHLSGCAACRGQLEEWRTLFGMLGALPRFAPAAGFADRVMAHVRLPEPWYVQAAARAGARLQVFVPKTTRGWATATAFLALPIAIFGALAAWVLSRPYVTAESLLSFAATRTQAVFEAAGQWLLATALQSDLALFVARSLGTISEAGLGAAGALAATTAAAIVLSVWVLYQNLFRPTTPRRGHHTYVSFSF